MYVLGDREKVRGRPTLHNTSTGLCRGNSETVYLEETGRRNLNSAPYCFCWLLYLKLSCWKTNNTFYQLSLYLQTNEPGPWNPPCRETDHDSCDPEQGIWLKPSTTALSGLRAHVWSDEAPRDRLMVTVMYQIFAITAGNLLMFFLKIVLSFFCLLFLYLSTSCRPTPMSWSNNLVVSTEKLWTKQGKNLNNHWM